MNSEVLRAPARTRRTAAVLLALLVALVLSVMSAPQADAGAGTARLNAGERLYPGERLVSPNGVLALIMQGDGNLVLYAPGGSARWQSNTDGNPGATAVMQGDGNFVVYSSAGKALWHTQSAGSGATWAQLQDDGNFVLYGPTGWKWQSGTKYYPSSLASPGVLYAGKALQSPNGVYKLVMQGDGNLVLYGPAGMMWPSKTAGTGVNRLAVQSDGNMVLYTATNVPKWQSYSSGAGAVVLKVQDDGNVVLYKAAGGYAWQTGTYPGGVEGGTTTKVEKAIAYAEQQIGKPYQWGAEGPNSFDCSGLTMQAWANAGVSIPRTSATQYAGLPKYPYSQRQAGDLIFYADSGGVHHVALYVGNDQMIEALKTGTSVRLVSVWHFGRLDYVARPG